MAAGPESNASPVNHRSDASQAGHALTFKLDHSSGADQGRNLTQLDPYLLKFPSISLFNKDCFHRHFSFSTLYILAPIV